MDKLMKFMPLALFCLYFGKTISQIPTAIEASILAILACFVGYMEYKSNDKKLSLIEESLKSFQSDLEMKQKEIESLKSTTTGLKLASGMKSMSGNNR